MLVGELGPRELRGRARAGRPATSARGHGVELKSEEDGMEEEIMGWELWRREPSPITLLLP